MKKKLSKILGAREMAQQLKLWLQHKLEELSSTPRSHVKSLMQQHASVILVSKMRSRDRAHGSAQQHSRNRDSASIRWTVRNYSRKLFSHLHMHAAACTHPQINTSLHNIKHRNAVEKSLKRSKAETNRKGTVGQE